MRYMMIVSGSEDFAASGPRPASLIEAIEKLGEEAVKNGKLVSFGGLNAVRRHSQYLQGRQAFEDRIVRRRGDAGLPSYLLHFEVTRAFF